MLDADTKRRIDTARDILVGKVPDPKSQVEQITIALVYKFMDDIDQESVDMGGKASFFTGEYEKYAWSRIFDPRMGGYEMLGLYADAITRMAQNPSLPQLFRDIFKNAYLPYRDPETLKLFLKTINDFRYDHSERLGDAFEYLLSVMSSQGDAGQFRTPRHLIDFMVQIVNPQKNETILDPACGTAGFLISAYKHILKENDNGKALTMQERMDLLKNFRGYDISPDMVRLSLVNVYLHGFQQPQIYEYDTLTSEDRWNEYADVILANPPFMSPKGGIRPHKRFSVQSNRSEVLFVDYMAEHLTPNGRAAIIVPEGIIFQSGKAYKQLRKYLVEQNYLWAVVSLPAGIFNPYSGVKTSILLLDRTLAKKTDKILFVKVEADGFDLGAQRRPIDQNDFPEVLEIINSWSTYIKTNKDNYSLFENISEKYQLISISILSADGDFSLSGNRYRKLIHSSHDTFPMISIEELCELGRGRVISKVDIEKKPGPYPVFSSQTFNNGIFGYLGTYDFEGEYATWTTDGANAGTVFLRNGKFNCTNVCGTLKSKTNKLNMQYLVKILGSVSKQYVIQVGNPKLMNKEVARIKIPLPPLEVQNEIVAEIEGYQRIIDGARQVVDNWKPNIEWELEEERRAAGVDAWPMVKLGEVCENITDGKHGDCTPQENSGFYFISAKDLKNGKIDYSEARQITKDDFLDTHRRTKLEPGDVLLSNSGSIGKIAIADNEEKIYKTTFQKSVALLKPNKFILDSRFLYYTLQELTMELKQISDGSSQKNLLLRDIRDFDILLPSLIYQLEIVARIVAEQKLVEDNWRLIQAFEVRIRKVIERVWE